MKRALTLCVCAVWAAAALALPARRGPDNPLVRLARLYEDQRFFELRDAVARMADNRQTEMAFFRGAVDVAFNRLGPAVAALTDYLADTAGLPPGGLTREARALLAEAYRRQGRYRDAAEAYQVILRRFGAELGPGTKARFEDQYSLWSALADVPPQTVDLGNGALIRMINRHFPARIGGREFFAGTDTGSNISVLYESLASDLGVPLLGGDIKAQTVTGKAIVGRAGLVREMRIGPIVIRNVVVLVLPDNLFQTARSRLGVDRRALLGTPVLEALKELTETRDGDLIIPARPGRRASENMCFVGSMPVVEVVHRGARLSLCLDTGSPLTYLYPPFFRRYRGEIQVRSRKRVSLLHGVGNKRSVDIRILDHFSFETDGVSVNMNRIPVQTEVTHADSRHFFGTLGTDILRQCRRMTFNFESMSFILE